MKDNQVKRSQRSLVLALVLGAGLLGSCVAQEDYDEAVDLAHDYQAELFELQRQATLLEIENGRLRREASVGAAGVRDAGYDEQFASEIEALRARINALGGMPTGTQRFDLGASGYIFLVPDAVIFDLGSAELSGEGRDELVRIASEINAAEYGRVWVRGHTDNTPIARPKTKERYPHGNLQLSAQRALEVATVLTATGGVDSSRVAILGFGEFEPLVPNDTAENKRSNRRVEIFVSTAH